MEWEKCTVHGVMAMKVRQVVRRLRRERRPQRHLRPVPKHPRPQLLHGLKRRQLQQLLRPRPLILLLLRQARLTVCFVYLARMH